MTCHRKLPSAVAACFVALTACAGAPSHPPARQPSPLPPSPLPRSSIAAVLAHRVDLALDEAQVAQLEKLEQELERRQAPLLEPPASRTRPASGAGPEQRPPRGGHSRSGRGRADLTQPPSRTELFDDADTAAFLEAERALREPQRAPASAIAESYREALSDARDRALR